MNTDPKTPAIDFDPETARLDTASKSYLETCVRLWQLGDYFQVKSMSELAKEKLIIGCDRWRRCSGTVDTAKHGTTFIVDIESAVRQAWREDLASSPLRAILTGLCVNFAPYLRRHQSFFTLLQEVSQFAVTFSQRAMGSITSCLRLPKPVGVIDAPSFGEFLKASYVTKLLAVLKRIKASPLRCWTLLSAQSGPMPPPHGVFVQHLDGAQVRSEISQLE